MDRWEWLEGVKAETPARVAVRELSKMLAAELRDWPPAVEWLDEASRLRFASLSEAPLSARARVEALRYFEWEMLRDFEAIDQYSRNHRLEETCASAHEQLCAVFVREYLSEAFLQLIEKTHNRVKRADIVEGLRELKILLERLPN